MSHPTWVLDGPRFGRLKDDPARMALCVGVFDARATLDVIAQALNEVVEK